MEKKMEAKKIKVWDYIKLRNFFTIIKKVITGVKRHATNLVKIFFHHSYDKGLISQTYKELVKLKQQKSISSKKEQR